ncbi:MAG TPA: hypothetical protein VFS66_11185 [Acidimicrobiia bacterium]|nr:hypothetical protein [Acidimicrobiia bacterium]
MFSRITDRHPAARWLIALAAIVVAFALAVPAHASNTRVPGHQHDRYDSDGNGYSDEGVKVTGKYESLYAYDDNADWYWDLGDGRVQGTVDAVEELDSETLTTCAYQVVYRADFGNDPFMDSGWITNNINCSGYDDNGTYHYLIVHETDPRYTGNPDWAIWGTWEYRVLTESGSGNLVRPERPVTS